MYECYEHIVFLIWFNDLFGTPMAVEIFHNNSLWQPKLLLIRWKLMQMSNVNKFIIHKCNTQCWSETGLTRVQQETPRIWATSSCCEQKTGEECHLQNLSTAKLLSLSLLPVCFLQFPLHVFCNSPCMFSELLSFDKSGVYGLHLAERFWWCRFCPFFCLWLIVWGWGLSSQILKELFRVQRFWRLRSLILETISYVRYSSKLTRPLT